MTSPLLVNTHLNNNNNNKIHGRWQPSINTSTIQEEDSLHRQGVIYEDSDEQGSIIEVDNENELTDNEDEVDDDDDEEEEEEEEMQDDDSDTYTSSPSIPDENIDFSLVYTLHTFEATVEGQASVTKGDSLTLLDDSNSYWWLVKVLKTNEVGYIPAENIETPFERLARLNKHRNVEVTSVQQAAHFIESDDDKKKTLLTKKDKHVTMSKGIYYQSYIILLGEDNEEVEETYEEYEDDMIDEDSQSATIASGDENDLDDDLDDDVNMNDNNNNNNQNDIGDEESSSRGVSIDDEVQGLNISTPTSSTAGTIMSTINNNNNNNNSTKPDDKTTNKSPDKKENIATPSLTQSDKNDTTSITLNNNNNNAPNTTSTSVGSPVSPKDDKDYKKQSSFLKLFSRGKKHDGKKNISQNDTSDQGSTNSSTISEDLQHLKDANVNSQTSSSSPSIVDPSATVLRVYAGNINVNATYNSVLVYDNTNAENLLRLSMDRFHISQIEGNSRGKRSASPYQLNSHNSGVEYYLSVKPMDGDERVLLPQDKPLMIYRSLTAHLTTPMPSLANIKQQIKNVEFGRIGSPTNISNKRSNAKYGEDSIRFYLHKRIRRVNEQNGQVYVKISLYQDDNDINKKRNNNKSIHSKEGIKRYSSSTSSLSSKNKGDGNNHLSSSFSMRRKKSTLSASSSTSSLATTQSQIDKLIAVPAIATVSELIDIALEKFHLAQSGVEAQQSRYRMTIVINNQGTEKHLNPNSKIVEVLHDDTHPESTSEKRFVLRKINTASTKSNAHNKDSRSNNHLNNKTTPKLSSPKPKNKSEINRGSASSPLLTPIPVMQLDTETEMVLRRLERALLTYNRKPTDGVPPRVHLDPHQPKLAVMRNVNKGIDVYLPHGILRSKSLTPQQTQFVLMANDEKNKDSNWNLVTQRVLSTGTATSSSAPTSPSTSTALPANNINNSFHGIELISDSDLKELIKFGTKFLESVEQNGALLNKDVSSSLLLEKNTPDTSSSLSSLDELERVSGYYLIIYIGY
ncbi:unnamed protein product [Cunninghamella blakesleeana]